MGSQRWSLFLAVADVRVPFQGKLFYLQMDVFLLTVEFSLALQSVYVLMHQSPHCK